VPRTLFADGEREATAKNAVSKITNRNSIAMPTLGNFSNCAASHAAIIPTTRNANAVNGRCTRTTNLRL
jgi:hypothetical protein